MSEYMDRDEILNCLTETHEKTIHPALFGKRPILIREIIGRQRLMASQAAQTDDPEQPDNALYRAMMIQMSIVDPSSGTPYADGRAREDGTPIIDPRTRKPLLSIADVQDIADGRDLTVDALMTEIATLSTLAPVSLFRGHSSSNGTKRNKTQGNRTREGQTEGEGLSAAVGGAVISDGAAGDVGGEPQSVEQ